MKLTSVVLFLICFNNINAQSNDSIPKLEFSEILTDFFYEIESELCYNYKDSLLLFEFFECWVSNKGQTQRLHVIARRGYWEEMFPVRPDFVLEYKSFPVLLYLNPETQIDGPFLELFYYRNEKVPQSFLDKCYTKNEEISYRSEFVILKEIDSWKIKKA